MDQQQQQPVSSLYSTVISTVEFLGGMAMSAATMLIAALMTNGILTLVTTILSRFHYNYPDVVCPDLTGS